MSVERPILFSGEMVRAILGGRKTQTRRVVKFSPSVVAEYDLDVGQAYDAIMADDSGAAAFLVAGDHGYTSWVDCPYGKPGDRLWVRETWAPYEDTNVWGAGIGSPVYRATWPPTLDERHDAGLLSEPKRWRPSIHMPRWASRITLEVTGVRVEQVQDISAEDAFAEGVRCLPEDTVTVGHYRVHHSPTLLAEFQSLWDTINAKRGYPWASNPWVWVVEFRVAERGRSPA